MWPRSGPVAGLAHADHYHGAAKGITTLMSKLIAALKELLSDAWDWIEEVAPAVIFLILLGLVVTWFQGPQDVPPRDPMDYDGSAPG